VDKGRKQEGKDDIRKRRRSTGNVAHLEAGKKGIKINGEKDRWGNNPKFQREKGVFTTRIDRESQGRERTVVEVEQGEGK